MKYLRPTALLLCLPLILSARSGAAQSNEEHRPPWAGTVASRQTLKIGGATIQVDFAPGDFDLKREEILHWIEAAATAVSTYFGQFPITRARILIVPIADKSGVLTGTTWGDVGGYPAFTRMRLGQHTSANDLATDWTMTHELVHMGFPSLPDDYHWLEEGLATYVEPIARVQAGGLTAEQIWGDMYRDMSKGEPPPAGEGLNHTHTWASTYWGGALFCLMADVKIRQQTGNRKGLQDALRGVIAASGTIDHDWPPAQALKLGDQATGTSVLISLFDSMGEHAQAVDLNSLWKQLGVTSVNGQVAFDEQAPLAAIRRAITAPHPMHQAQVK